jgi:hypothetical protein
MGEVILWLFFVGLAGPLVYVTVLALRLSNGSQDTGSTEALRIPEVSKPTGSPETAVPEQGGDQGNGTADQ